MPQTRNNGGVVPVPSDPYNPPADWATQTDSLDVVRRVGSDSVQAALTGLRVGTVMCRYDKTGQPLFTWNGTQWISAAGRVVVPGLPAGSIPIMQMSEASVLIGAGSAGSISFPEAFPNGLRSLLVTDSTAGANAIVVKARMDLSNAGAGVFTAFNSADGTGIASGTTLYVNYIATGY